MGLIQPNFVVSLFLITLFIRITNMSKGQGENYAKVKNQ
ncbi:hypothetical protein AZO1586R_826 [Bathymodiolus azoricus thioautotrophic gill symbiont]|uniref:Uncharacterized protein n=1 Tax=Bathymodiolus azoricus thioautotrophic gill symbiont TaxID=235205 RepID=A0ACA8ZW00_9GAMM|nr:hypothetical protein AZO1586R_826 [Bathymodiolus azoricus thioautotrophic gill symbiont]